MLAPVPVNIYIEVDMTAGRPPKKIDMKKVEELARAGKTDAEIAKGVGITRSTLAEKKKTDVKLSDTLKDWKDEADKKVEFSLYDRACGVTGPDGKWFPPDPTAMIFWLKNRQPKAWRDKQEVEHSGTVSLAETLKQARERE